MDHGPGWTGQPEMAEPLESSSLIPPSNQQSSTPTSALKSQHSTSSIPTLKKGSSSQTTPTTHSPKPSREASPIRPTPKQSTSSRTGGRQRKNSTDPSPTRSASVIASTDSSTATAYKALSTANIPQIQPSISEPEIKSPTPQKPAAPRETPRWPISPRLRSPPPVIKPLTALRKSEQDVPSINLQRATPATEGPQVGSEGEDSTAITGMRATARGASGAGSTLETVQEISQPGTPAVGLDGSREQSHMGLQELLEQPNPMDLAFARSLKKKASTGANESGSESGGNKDESKLRSASAAPTSSAIPPNTVVPAKSLSTGTVSGRGKPSGEGSTKNMIVETETVSSIPQVAVGGTGAAGGNSSLRTKPSSETIRPKKDKKKTTRKAPSVTSGTASSKADIFEAKIASAVDEANSSDSEETFVYESNPPETSDRPRRFHSRTPSATSMASQVDQRGNQRSMHGVMDGVHGVAMKKSMKFANSYNSNGPEHGAGEDDGRGTGRSNMGTGRGTTHHHHHIGRWGRNGGNGHPSLFDNESPFPNAATPKAVENTSRNSSRPSSPRVAQTKMINGKKNSPTSSGYDMDEGARADDERTPLMGSGTRGTRSVRGRRQPFSIRQLEHQESRQSSSFLNRFAGCLVLSIMILLVVSGAIGFLFATTQPLTEVKVLALRHIIATEQELMLDMEVMARNPNIVVINIEAMDMEIFAKSKHAGTDSEWWKRPQLSSHVEKRRRGYSNVNILDDDPSDPPNYDDPSEIQTMRLGTVYDLDSPLIFEGSPFKHIHSIATGQIRLLQPGNATADGGTERWERILKYEFELVLKGVLKYQLPMSQRIRKVDINARVTVTPDQKDKILPEETGEFHIV